MDIQSISQTAQDTFTILQPYIPIIATQAAEKLGSELPAAVGKLWQKIKARFDEKPAAQDALLDLLKSPGDGDLQAAFRVQLRKMLEADEDFAQSLKELLAEAKNSAGTTYQAHAAGGSAVAQGPGAKAVGGRGVLIEGDVEGSTLITGDENESKGKP